jgi:hypothetical protein
MTETWPQPFEGIRGTDLSRHWLLSLDEQAVPHREALIAMAHHLRTATLVGSPAPVVRRMSDRLRQPEPGDLVVTTEVMHGRPDPDDRLKGLGVFLAGRKEWAETDAQWEAYKAENYGGSTLADEDRMTDTVFYIQYGPDPGDICRWHNSEAVVLPVDIGGFSADGAASREETSDGRVRATFTRDSLIGGLADSGFYLRGEPGPLPEDGAEDLLVTVRVPAGEITAVEAATDPAGSVRQ